MFITTLVLEVIALIATSVAKELKRKNRKKGGRS